MSGDAQLGNQGAYSTFDTRLRWGPQKFAKIPRIVDDSIGRTGDQFYT